MKQTNTRVVTLALLVGTFLTAIEGTVVSTAMPKIVSELQGIELMNWVFAVYLLLSAVTVPVFGKLSDLFGRKGVFMFGTVVFLVGSSLCGMAHTMGQLILFRAIQGIGAGAIMPVTSTIMADIYPVEKRAKMIGLVSTMWAIAGVAGPLVGGFFVDQMTWNWIFFMNIPFGIISMVMIGLGLHERVEKKKHSIDYAGAVTFICGMLGLLFALQKGGEDGAWTSPLVVSLFVISAVLIAVFIWIETKAKEPMIPLKLFKTEGILAANTVSLLISALLIGVMVYIPMWVQGVLGFGATVSGFIITPMSITWMIGSFICGRLMMKAGVRMATFLGMILLVLSMLWLLFLGQASSTLHFYAVTALLGIGFGVAFTICTVTVQSAVGWELRGAATASNMFFRTLGQTVGVALFGTWFNAKLSSVLTGGEGASLGLTLDQMNELINPATADRLSDQVQSVLRGTLVAGLHHLFILLFAISLVGFILTWLLPRAALEGSGSNPNKKAQAG
ncbi:MFS transporter [Paenibacillus doosanensis]|uniref:MDR family MFS transporter n=1 Tax=Paenibacillus TaxID=44249 RepID=UPI00201E090C|nr:MULTISPECIES: MDR family MFS transporter [Paenibacillus]MCS7462711.1 MFS transporter [Paenibacillus doosanensis]